MEEPLQVEELVNNSSAEEPFRLSLDDFSPLQISLRAQERDRHGSHLALSSEEDQCSFSTVYIPSQQSSSVKSSQQLSTEEDEVFSPCY